ncbi:PPE domain-containing protein, partial [Mycobacterium sp. PS03-16]
MGDQLQVEQEALNARAGVLEGKQWPPAPENVMPPDGLPFAPAVAENINTNARALAEYNEYARAEAQRFAGVLREAATAYGTVDSEYRVAIENPERRAAMDAISLSPGASLPPVPGAVPLPKSLDPGGYSDVMATQAQFEANQGAATALRAAIQYNTMADELVADLPDSPVGNWEGDAAYAAAERFTKYRQWVTELSQAWRELAAAAAKVAEAHQEAYRAHTAIAANYKGLEDRLKAEMSRGWFGDPDVVNAIQKQMAELQQHSEQIREDYAGKATFSTAQPP